MENKTLVRMDRDWKGRIQYEEKKRLEKLKETVKDKVNDRN